jgi:4-amino-4-deoxy-L-arabinose transferase-like glycosyltransferase
MPARADSGLSIPEGRGDRIGLVAALLYALNPSSLRFANELLTEILFGLLLTAAVWMFARHIRKGKVADALWCGVLFGLAILCKPNLQFLPLALLALLAHGLGAMGRGASRQGWWQGLVAAIGAIVLLLSPWVIRNRIVFGEWFYTRTFDDNLAHVSAVSTLAHSRGEAVAPWSARWEALYDEVIVETALRYGWESVADAQISARERDLRLQQLTEVAGEIVREHPVDFVLAHTKAWLWSFVPQEHKFWTVWLTGEPWPVAPHEGDAFGRALQAAAAARPGRACASWWRSGCWRCRRWRWRCGSSGRVLYAVAAVLFVVGALRLRPRLLALFLVVTVFYVTFVPGPISQIRFRLPVVPIILLLATVGALGDHLPGCSGDGRSQTQRKLAAEAGSPLSVLRMDGEGQRQGSRGTTFRVAQQEPAIEGQQRNHHAATKRATPSSTFDAVVFQASCLISGRALPTATV